MRVDQCNQDGSNVEITPDTKMEKSSLDRTLHLFGSLGLEKAFTDFLRCEFRELLAYPSFLLQSAADPINLVSSIDINFGF